MARSNIPLLLSLPDLLRLSVSTQDLLGSLPLFVCSSAAPLSPLVRVTLRQGYPFRRVALFIISLEFRSNFSFLQCRPASDTTSPMVHHEPNLIKVSCVIWAYAFKSASLQIFQSVWSRQESYSLCLYGVHLHFKPTKSRTAMMRFVCLELKFIVPSNKYSRTRIFALLSHQEILVEGLLTSFSLVIHISSETIFNCSQNPLIQYFNIISVSTFCVFSN